MRRTLIAILCAVIWLFVGQVSEQVCGEHAMRATVRSTAQGSITDSDRGTICRGRRHVAARLVARCCREVRRRGVGTRRSPTHGPRFHEKFSSPRSPTGIRASNVYVGFRHPPFDALRETLSSTFCVDFVFSRFRFGLHIMPTEVCRQSSVSIRYFFYGNVF